MQRHPTGRVALVTGAARGLGQIFAQRLAHDGCRVVLVDLLDCSETASFIGNAGQASYSVACDLSNPSQIKMLAEQVLSQWGHVDILVNNAAYQPIVPLADLTSEIFKKILTVNTEASLLLSQAFAPGMIERGWGRIINLASSSAWSPPPGFVAYITSKMANIGLTRALALELGDAGITVNAIAPGLTKTEAAARDIPSAAFEAVKAQQLIHRTGMPQDLAGALSFLCSDDASFITGQTLHVSGGAVV